ncbi:HotDog domain-containing protein [Xylariaceae sp. FL0804]|nr:HotDog domain-containing protein [Xylariaceae sp. FL0804]
MSSDELDEPSGRDFAGRDHFAAIPWCAELLNTPGLTLWSPPRDATLWTRTLNVPDAVAAFLLFYRAPATPRTALVEEVSALVSLGPGINGFPGVAHGGIIAVTFDEVLGRHVWLNGSDREGGLPNPVHMTKYLTSTFARPVPVPGTYRVVSRIARHEGRRVYVTGEMRDGEGTVLATADALWVAVKTKL